MSIQGIGNEISFSDYHSAVVALRESAPFAPHRGLESVCEVARARAQIATLDTSANTLFDYPHIRMELATYVGDKIAAQVPSVKLIDPVRLADYQERTAKLKAAAELRKEAGKLTREALTP